MKKTIKKGFCPKCNKIMVRKMAIRRKKVKPTQCGNCGFIIQNPYEVFNPVRK